MNCKVIKFAFVGAGGFLVDCLTFSLLYYVLGLPLMAARVGAFFVAATSTWYGNRVLTFQYEGKGCCKEDFKQWQKFMASACFSAIPNLLCFKVVSLFIPTFHGSMFIAMAVGVLVGMVSNFLLSKYWVFAPSKQLE